MNVLMICYGYPPIGGAGMIRPLKFAKFLPSFGWQPTVLTPKEGVGQFPCPKEMGDLPGVRVVRTEYTDVVMAFKKRIGFSNGANGVHSPSQHADAASQKGQLLNQTHRGFVGKVRLFAYDLLTTPDPQIGWYRHAVEAGRQILQAEKYDVIFTTSPPETSHLIARSLKKEFGIPWVAELRDPWSFDHYRNNHKMKSLILRKMEQRVFKDADALVTVSDVWQKKLARLHKREVHCITHGFDPDDYPAADLLLKEFTLLYTGTLDRDFQDPEMLFSVLASLIQEGAVDPEIIRVHFHVYGNRLPDFNRLLNKYCLHKVVRQLPLLDYRRCLEAQKNATILLVVNWSGEVGKGVQNVKGYEYLGAARPTLLIGSKEAALSRLVREVNGGETAETPAALRQILLDWYKEFVATGTVKFKGNAELINHYTRRAQTEKLVRVFEKTLGDEG